MISTVAAPIEAVATAGFFAKFCCDAKQGTTFLGIIAAVAGLAYSIFQNSMLGIIGFVLLGIFTFAYSMFDNKEIENVEKKLASGAEQNAEQTRDLNHEMAGQIQELTQNRAQMEAQLNRLQTDNQQRQQTQVQLEATETKLKAEVQTLKQTNAALEANLSSMKENGKLIQNQVQTMLQENLSLGTKIGAFDQSVGNLAKHKEAMTKQVSDLQAGLEVNMTTLVKQLELAANASKDLMTSVNQKASSIESQFNDELAKTQRLEKELESHSKVIDDERKQIDAALVVLTKKEADIARREETVRTQDAAFKATHADLRAQTKTLQALFEKISNEKETAEANLAALNQVLASKLQLIDQYDQAIAKKQGELEKIKAAAKTIPR